MGDISILVDVVVKYFLFLLVQTAEHVECDILAFRVNPK